MLCLVAQSCPTLCNPMDYRPPGSSVHGDSPGKNIGMGCHVLLQGIFPTQGWTQVSHIAGRLFKTEPPGKLKNTKVGSLSPLQGIFLTQELNQGLLHCSRVRNLPPPSIFIFTFCGFSWRSLVGGNGNTLQYYFLENSIDRRVWQATVHGIAKKLHMTEHAHGNQPRSDNIKWEIPKIDS